MSNDSVRQSGTVTRGHAVQWTTEGVIQDAGTAAEGSLTSIGTTGEGPTVGLNSAEITDPYNALTLSVYTDQNARITVQNYGGAPQVGLDFYINGNITSLPSNPGGIFITGTAPFVANGLAAFSNTSGNIVDSGLRAVGGIVTVGEWNATVIGLSAGGTGASTAIAARSNLGLGTMSTQNANAVAVTGGTITGMPNPSISSDVANKAYVDSTSAGLIIIAPSDYATAAVLPNSPTYSNGASGVGATLTAGSNTTLTVDATVVALNKIVLVKNQAAPAQNGIFKCTAAGDGSNPWVLTRVTYFDQAAEMQAGSYTFITAGSANLGSAWVLSTTITTVGTDAVTFFEFSSQNTGVTSLAGLTGAVLLGTAFSLSGQTVNFIGFNVKAYGAIGNDSANDTNAVQLAINAAQSASATGGQGVVLFPTGVYSCTNLDRSGIVTFRGLDTGAVIRARSGGDSAYLLADSTWVNNNNSSDPPMYFDNIYLDGNSLKSYTYVCKSYQTEARNSAFYGATVSNFLISTASKSGAAHSAIIDVHLQSCRIGNGVITSSQQIEIIDPTSQATDNVIDDCELSECTGTALQWTSGTCAGWRITNNHIFLGTGGAGTYNAQFQRPSNRCEIEGNTFEGDVLVINGDTVFPVAKFGPGNTMGGNFLINSSALTVVSQGNHYSGAGNVGSYVQNLENSATSVLISQDDTFYNTTPLRTTGAGIVVASNSWSDAYKSFMNGRFNSSSISPDAAGLGTGQRPPWFTKIASDGTNSLSISLVLPNLASFSGYRFTFDIGLRQNTTATVRVAYHTTAIFTRTSVPGTWALTNTIENITPAQWSAGPTFSMTESGNNVTLTVTGTFSTSDGYGMALLTAL